MKIEVHKPAKQELDKMGVNSWSIWEKDVSRFDWFYESAEECYFLQGAVVVETPDGKKVEIGKGDFVRFPQGLSCTWDVKQPVRKHYRFE